MKTLSQIEIQNLIHRWQQYVGWYVQDTTGSGQELGLRMYGQGSVWFWIDATAHRPLMVALEGMPPGFRKEAKPIMLFLHKHVEGLALQSVRELTELGRAVQFEFRSPQKSTTLDVILIPHRFNVIVRTVETGQRGEKKLSWFKPKELKQIENTMAPIEPRAEHEIVSQWLTERAPKSQKSTNSSGLNLNSLLEQLRKDIYKHKNIVTKLQEGLLELQAEQAEWSRLGEALKQNGFTHLTDAQRAHLKSAILAQEIDRCFTERKKRTEKIIKTQNRLDQIQTELQHDEDLLRQAEVFNANPARPFTEADKKISADILNNLKARFKKAEGVKRSAKEVAIKYRTLRSQKGFELHVGRSGVENLELLRKAQPWHLWLHLRDYTGSFGILPRKKNEPIPDADLWELCAQLIAYSATRAQGVPRVGRFQILCAECRFVRPIKGAKSGLVSYHNERVVTVDLPFIK